MRRDREHELDLAYIGGEADAATHVRKIAQPSCTPKGLDSREVRRHSPAENERGTRNT
jgi:hypothetical protein